MRLLAKAQVLDAADLPVFCSCVSERHPPRACRRLISRWASFFTGRTLFVETSVIRFVLALKPAVVVRRHSERRRRRPPRVAPRPPAKGDRGHQRRARCPTPRRRAVARAAREGSRRGHPRTQRAPRAHARSRARARSGPESTPVHARLLLLLAPRLTLSIRSASCARITSIPLASRRAA